VRLWDLANGGVQERQIALAGVEALAFTAGGIALVAGGVDGSLSLLPSHGEVEGDLLHKLGDAVRGLALSADGAFLGAVGWDGRVALFHFPSSSGEDGWTFGQANGSALAFTPDGEHLAVGASSEVLLLPLHYKGAPQQIPIRGDSPLLSLALSRVGGLFATGHTNGSIHLCEASQGKRLKTLHGHTWTIYSLDFTPDGRTLLSGSADGTARLWDVATGTERHCYKWHKRWVTCATLSPDGMTAAAGSEDATIVVWDVDE
jgi:WD40 repeat protein